MDMPRQYLFGQDFHPPCLEWCSLLPYCSQRSSAQQGPTANIGSFEKQDIRPVAADKLATTFAGGNGQAGNMIEVLASKNASRELLRHPHLAANGSVHAYVYVKKGSYRWLRKSSLCLDEDCRHCGTVGQGSPNGYADPRDRTWFR